MRVGIIQSSYVPWRGYFDFIDAVDIFIVYDTVQFSKGSWRNRNLMKTRAGTAWLTVPVRHISLHQSIAATSVDDTQRWRKAHRDRFRESYKSAPYFELAMNVLEQGLTSATESLSGINLKLIQATMRELGIFTPIIDATDLVAQGSATERLISMVRAVGGTTYLSGPAADSYLDKAAFRDAGLGLQYKSYDYDDYPQLWGEFVSGVSALDLLANVGCEARRYLKSKSADIWIVSPGQMPAYSGVQSQSEPQRIRRERSNGSQT